MAVIASSAVASLRESTGFPMMDCKNALAESQGDPEKAALLLRSRLGPSEQTVRSGEGYLTVSDLTFEELKRYAILGVSTQTDFAARSEVLRNGIDVMAQEMAEIIEGEADLDDLETLRQQLGEDVRICVEEIIDVLPTQQVGEYIHHDRKSAAIVVFENAEGIDQSVLDGVAMHVVAATPAPVAISVDQIPSALLDAERQIHEAAAATSGKSPEIQAKMVEGRLRKFAQGLALIEQPYVFDGKTTVGKIIKNATIVAFRKYTV